MLRSAPHENITWKNNTSTEQGDSNNFGQLFVIISRNINPILHTVWLDSHALTLKHYTAKYYEARKIWFFAYLTNFLSSIEENCSHVYIVFLLL